MGENRAEAGPVEAGLRASTLERVLAEKTYGWTLSDLSGRLGEAFDLGDILVVLRRRSDLFLESEGKWLSAAACLHQNSRRATWNFKTDSTPAPWRRFHNPIGAAAGWLKFRHRLHDTASDPSSGHIELRMEEGRLPEVRIHVNHTLFLGRATWVIWTVTDDPGALELLQTSGLFLWSPHDSRALIDPRSRLTHVDTLAAPTLASWSLQTSTELAETLTWLLLEVYQLWDPRKLHVTVERVPVHPNDSRHVARSIGANHRRGGAIPRATCMGCGRPLYDANSVALGYGPTCAGQRGHGWVSTLTDGVGAVLFVGTTPLADVRRLMALEAKRLAATPSAAPTPQEPIE